MSRPGAIGQQPWREFISGGELFLEGHLAGLGFYGAHVEDLAVRKHFLPDSELQGHS